MNHLAPSHAHPFFKGENDDLENTLLRTCLGLGLTCAGLAFTVLGLPLAALPMSMGLGLMTLLTVLLMLES